MKCSVEWCPRCSAWNELCSVHAARELEQPVSVREALMEVEAND